MLGPMSLCPLLTLLSQPLSSISNTCTGPWELLLMSIPCFYWPNIRHLGDLIWHS